MLKLDDHHLWVIPLDQELIVQRRSKKKRTRSKVILLPSANTFVSSNCQDCVFSLWVDILASTMQARVDHAQSDWNSHA